MNLKLLFSIICFQAALFCFSQTEEQKQMMYQKISQDFTGMPGEKNQRIESKKSLFLEAEIFPVYRIILNAADKPAAVKNDDSFMVLYRGNFYALFKDDFYMLFESRPEIKNINELIKSKKDFTIAYFTDYNYSGEIFNILITDNRFSFVLEKDKKYSSIAAYIDHKYGSLAEFKRLDLLEKKRSELTLKDIAAAYRVNFRWYEGRCPKDTALIVKKAIDQIKKAAEGVSTSQEANLLKRINSKIFLLGSAYNHSYKEQDNELTIQHPAENKNNAAKQILTPEESILQLNYDIYIYKVNIISDISEVLTEKQLLQYKNYIDLYFPAIRGNNTGPTSRYTYGIEAYKKESHSKVKNKMQLQVEYGSYFEKEFGPFDCPFDKTIKREIIIR